MKRAQEEFSEENPEPKKSSLSIDVSQKYNPEKLKLVKIIRNDNKMKMISLHCKSIEDDKDALVMLQKSAFPTDMDKLREGGIVDCNELSEAYSADTLQSNDIYHRILIKSGLESLNEINMTVIHPAGPEHFDKYSSFGRVVIQETPVMYKNVIIPFLNNKPKDLQWVDNILNGSKEQDRVLHATDEYTVVLDFKWDLKRMTEMHCLGLVRDPNLTCLRDLRAEHIPMIESMFEASRKVLLEKYANGTENDRTPLKADRILSFFHYPPTFYRLHMHVVHIDTPEEASVRCGKAHLVEDVIQNLRIKSDFYSTRTITAVLGAQSKMLEAIHTHNKKNHNDAIIA